VAIDPWIPIGFCFPDGLKTRLAIQDGENWQLYEADKDNKVLVVRKSLGVRWLDEGLLTSNALILFNLGKDEYYSLSSSKEHMLCPVTRCPSIGNKNEVISFAEALRLTREIDKSNSLHDSIYVEKYSRLLPTYCISDSVGDDIVLGYWLSGGVPVSINSTRRFQSLAGWLNQSQLQDIIERSGIKKSPTVEISTSEKGGKNKKFSLVGRTYLESFFNEHVIDIVENQDRYKALGIGFPSAIILYGPPGCGKTFAVEKLVEYLEWPSFSIEASSVASPYIHETSKKISSVFEAAIKNSPSVVIIDEMDAFLAERQSSHQHSIEEISEFLKRIPDATKNNVLVVGMTNRIDAIDQAILRRGRFDHVIKVDMASEQEILALLTKLINDLPHDTDIQVAPIAKHLCGRPLSDVAFIVREGARLAARSGKEKIDQGSLMNALQTSPSRDEEASSNKIGFIV